MATASTIATRAGSARRTRRVNRRGLVSSLLVAGAVAAGIAAYATWPLGGRESEVRDAARPAAPAHALRADAFGLGADALRARLRRAGYSIPAHGRLDPVAKAAAADFLGARDVARLDPSLAEQLSHTIVTGRRDPAAWNARFGLNRATRMVERPLTGIGGQLDPDGNLANTR